VTIIAVDIGGTFTDICCLSDRDGRRRLAWTKEPSTRDDPVLGVVRGVTRMLRETGLSPSTVTRLLHGTTVGTNAVLERKGARVGLLMTEGFEHTLELGRGSRSDMYRLDPEPETPGFLAPGRRRRPVRERIAFDGEVILPLDEDALRDAITDLVERENIEALAVCYLFSFVNPVHESRTAEIVREMYPGLPVSLSHAVDPLFREYERVCMTAFDAYLRPVMTGYLDRLARGLRAADLHCDVLTMQSRGSLASTRAAAARPFTTLLSGPAAGVVGARRVAKEAGFSDCITLDMGGTSADIALIADDKPLTTQTGRIENFPLRTPMVDINTIGAGGGSIAWLDEAGGLRVGPRSAGADPGPACYGRGGAQATVTDASVVLGYLSPDHFAGGIAIDPDAAHLAVEKLARRLGLSVPETGAGIHRIVNARMADEIRLVSLRRGFDPRRFVLVLFGGGGPVCGWSVARELEISTALVPFAPGALCAYGLTSAAVEYDEAVTVKILARAADPDRLEAAFARLHETGMRRMAEDGIAEPRVAAARFADMRISGQSYELQVPIGAPVTPAAIETAVAAFIELHRRVYGHVNEHAPVEIVNLRMTHGHAIDSDTRRLDIVPPLIPEPAPSRLCWFAEAGGMVATRILGRGSMTPGVVISGPAVIHQLDTTTVVGPGCACRTDDMGNLILSIP
jgi:N-methylhydantoinase A/oxoprolinase/acetone carboxylase beta subunit